MGFVSNGQLPSPSPSIILSGCKDDDDDEKREMPIGPLAVLLSLPALCCCRSYNAPFRSICMFNFQNAVGALLAVKKQLFDPSNHLRNWNKGDPCTSNWTGIECSDHPGNDGYIHVEKLQLQNMNLSGTLVSELGQLSRLIILDFMWNALTGSIPKEIGQISTLELLLLNGNNLSGSLPDELGYLSKLNRFQIDENNLSGQIPKAYGNLSSVKHIHFNNNSLSGQIPPELSQISTLLHLLLDNNNLSGYLPPDFSTLPDLRILQLDNNNFNGVDIPASYGNFSRLVKLSLRNCSLQGEVPDLSRIPRLSYLDLSQNHLTGPIPSNKLSDNMTTIDLSDNQLNGSIPESFSDLPSLQTLSLQNNFLTGPVPTNIWQNMHFNTSAILMLDLRNNSFSSIEGNLNPPVNVILRLEDNPVCQNASLLNISLFCGSQSRKDEMLPNLKVECQNQSCPKFYEYVPASPVPCHCAAPLRIGYRLKSPSFSYFAPYIQPFGVYLTSSLNFSLYQMSIDTHVWEERRLRMYLMLFPNVNHSNTFDDSEVRRIRDIYASWAFDGSDLFGPYELLNFTLEGPYADLDSENKGVSKHTLVAVVAGGVASAVVISVIIIILITRRHARHYREMSRKRKTTKDSMQIEGVRNFTFKEMALASDNFNSSTQVGQGGYGKVYKGSLSDKTVVAIKRAEEGSLQGQDEFLTEITLLSRLHHRNLVSLVGYCDEDGEQMLVYEFMPNGTLRNWLSAPVLEEEGAVPTHVSTVVKGTPGYLDPEYFLTHKLTDKSDVYSLGVVFLELLTGMEPIWHGKNIVREVNTAYESGRVLSLIDSRLGWYPSECMERMVGLALSCCHDNPEKRPSMLEVVRELEYILGMMPQTDSAYSSLDSIHLYSDKSVTVTVTVTEMETETETVTEMETETSSSYGRTNREPETYVSSSSASHSLLQATKIVEDRSFLLFSVRFQTYCRIGSSI
ncbi:hypothetical protein V6N13_080024 [Hibiscus sabdariffa]